jgi:nucleoside-diphosphate-sugar epimerase
MKIAVTGGSGNVGRAVIKLALAQGHSVVSVDRIPYDARGKSNPDQHDLSDTPNYSINPDQPAPGNNFCSVQADITDYDALVSAFRGCDALVHQAAIPAPGHFPDHVVHNNNVTGSYNAMRAAVEVGIERICQASSVNATGLAYSRWPRFDYFPLDEEHPTYSEDPYSLSKWICEEQGNSLARRYERLTISSMRFHWVVPDRATAVRAAGYSQTEMGAKNLWAYTTFAAAARACLLSLSADFKGHEVFYITAPKTVTETPSLELAHQFFPDVPVRGDLGGFTSFFNCAKAERLLGWKHD